MAINHAEMGEAVMYLRETRGRAVACGKLAWRLQLA
jgi:hypothetical protein